MKFLAIIFTGFYRRKIANLRISVFFKKVFNKLKLIRLFWRKKFANLLAMKVA